MGTYVPLMPWAPNYTESEARAAITGAGTWRAVLDALGYEYHGKSINTVRKWARRWGISTEHLPDQRGRVPSRLRYSHADLREAVAASQSWAETLRRLGYCPTGGNWKTIKRRTAELGIPTGHFDPYASARGRPRRDRIPLEEILVEGSTYSRTNLKQRLYSQGIKAPICELCGQGDDWHGKRIGMILDHVNGVRDDNRLENLRIVCPNCAATFDTHCGRKNRVLMESLPCRRCGRGFTPRYRTQRYCSRECGSRWDRTGYRFRGARKVERPPYERLVKEIDALGYCAVGRKYGVSDNAVRKSVV